ncbi:hypothetical protein Q31b_47460 [Novipirellula aureliae]|uniref:Uncharacterized protein n=1 Tax=Novipirellula aureliae TaxID=2527966 RepID=A0A5C6DJQ0_9BACT|nr:hypothetical protein [Novipirellula aureliae]TWU36465.1 hypothetical protein Q31b_47460 [Novipirellula aureliae]
MNGIYKDDPTATYRGYRRQALYCLYRLFDDGLSDDTIIQPEGNEDLEIQDSSGQRLEVVQVKDYSANLSASNFKPSFYRRISDLCASDASVKIKIVSFGEIGPELLKAYDNDKDTPKRSIDTLTKDRDETDKDGNKKTIKGLSEAEAKEVFKRIEVEVVDEETLTKHVVDKLKATMTSGNPEVAFVNLMWWLISSAEKQRRLTRSKTVEKLTQLGKFVAYRNAHAQEWNVSIKPIESASSDAETREKLSQEFFQGGRVRAEHVAAGLDVPRDPAITSIHEAFLRENVVILRGASGQGKTTLAYRYLLDWAPSDFRYQVEKAASLEHARLMAAAIAGHADIIDVPSMIYIDVRPGDNWWVEVVRELAGVNGIRVLVTLREEDWFRSRVSPEDFAFADVSMDFTEESASQIFENLRNAGYGDKQLDFQDAWSKLGDRKTLFEFVYLVTQNESLSQRVKAQIGILKDEVNKGELVDKELHLLRLVAVASAYEARLDLKALAESIALPEPTRALERFGNEYLLRTSADGKHVEGFHAIRSEMIARELTDPVLQPRGKIESLLPPLVIEDDLESLLLCSFSRNENATSDVVRRLDGIQLDTWTGVRGVLVALQWLGIKQYAGKNTDLVAEVRSISPTSWWFTLDWDLAHVKGDKGFAILQQLAKTTPSFAAAAAVSKGYQNRQSNKNEVFDFARQWLGSFPIPQNDLDSVTHFAALGETLYWLGHLGQENPNVSGWLNDQTITDAWNLLPLQLFARFAAGIFKFAPELYTGWVREHREEVERRIRSDATIIALVEDDDCLVAHFVIDIEREASDLKSAEQETSVNDLAVQRVEIVSACLPGYARYGAAGYGHQMSLFESLGDDSTKRMPLENITMPWLPEFNALSRGAVEFGFRPESWDDYFAKVRELREKIGNAFSNFRQVLAKNGDSNLLDTAAWDECNKCLSGEFLLPKSAVDEWGFMAESRSDKSLGEMATSSAVSSFMESMGKKFVAKSNLDPFNRALNEFTNTLGNFFSQAIQALALVPDLRTAVSERARQAILDKGKELGVIEDSIRLSVLNGMDALIALRKLQETERTLNLTDRLEFDDGFSQKELRDFLETMRSWMLFCYPDQVLPNTSKQKKKRRKNTKVRSSKELRDCLQATANRLSQELKKLKKGGIDAKIISETVPWYGETCLWISFDTEHPLGSLVAVEAMWKALVEALRPDRDKIVRSKTIDYLWSKIVLVPLVQGRSLDRQAYAHMKGASYALDEDPATQLWRFVPEEIPISAWGELGLPQWSHPDQRKVFDDFTIAYGTTFQHVDHMADFTRCKVDLDEDGERVFLEYAQRAAKRVEPFVQETFDSCEELLKHFPELNEEVIEDRPNILNCMNLIVAMGDAIKPSEDFDEKQGLTIDEMADWRNRLRDGLNLLGEAQSLWMADYLGIPGFDYPDDSNEAE